jgi:chromosomal replication initiator protein
LRRLEDMAKQFFAEPVQISINLPEAPKERLNAMHSQAQFTRNCIITPAPEQHFSPCQARCDAPTRKPASIPTFTFDTLVTGRANDLARAAAYQVALNPGTSYNPLFVYGGVGLGKTHLIHALGNEVYRQNPDKVIRYVHAEDYYADVVRAYQQKSFDVFKRYYRSLDLLLIDDIQFFNNKNRTQEEFFYAFNALIEAKKQIVITCDTYPKDITGLEDRLISRFDWGLTVPSSRPSSKCGSPS